MSEIGEAVEAIIALGFGGFVVLLMASSIDHRVAANLQGFGALLIVGAFILVIVLVLAIITKLGSRL